MQGLRKRPECPKNKSKASRNHHLETVSETKEAYFVGFGAPHYPADSCAESLDAVLEPISAENLNQ